MKLHLLVAAALVGAGCAWAQAPAAVVAPNPNLVVQGIPPVPQALADKVAAYTDFRGHGLADWHPQKREMLVLHRAAGASVAQLFRLDQPQGPLQAMTQGTDPVSEASYAPRDGRFVVFERAAGGSEVTQIYRLDAPLAEPLQITPADERHEMSGWLERSGWLLYTSLPLDRTAQGGRRDEINTTLWAVDPLKPEGRRRIAQLPGGGWWVGGVSRDERRIALTRYVSANESEVWLLDARTGERRLLLSGQGAGTSVANFAQDFSRDGRKLWVATDRFGEFRELALADLKTGELTRVSGHIPWDLAGAALREDGRELAALFNVEGRSELRRFDTRTLKELAPWPTPPGSITGVRYARAPAAQRELALVVNNARGPSQVTSIGGGPAVAWTQPHVPAGLDTASFSEQRVVRWKSFDGLEISGLLSLPPARFAGRRPVLISIHGGPEAQATVGFLNRSNYYTQELGVALLQPNVRGSAGFGKRFLALDNGVKREDAVKDIGALLDWIATQPNLDPARVMVTGGSYGGYMSLAVAFHYADRIVGAIDVVGISHFVTFLTNTESYRRDLRRVEYGDERDPAMREFLDRISPLTNAGRIKKPLFVVQGKNDPRVPYTEAEQIVAKVRENGTPVWYLRAENEGHGFARKENADFNFYANILFMQQYLLGEGGASR